MKKLIFLLFALSSSQCVMAQADDDQMVFVYSNEDQSYDVTYNTNFVDVYLQMVFITFYCTRYI